MWPASPTKASPCLSSSRGCLADKAKFRSDLTLTENGLPPRGRQARAPRALRDFLGQHVQLSATPIDRRIVLGNRAFVGRSRGRWPRRQLPSGWRSKAMAPVPRRESEVASSRLCRQATIQHPRRAGFRDRREVGGAIDRHRKMAYFTRLASVYAYFTGAGTFNEPRSTVNG